MSTTFRVNHESISECGLWRWLVCPSYLAPPPPRRQRALRSNSNLPRVAFRRQPPFRLYEAPFEKCRPHPGTFGISARSYEFSMHRTSYSSRIFLQTKLTCLAVADVFADFVGKFGLSFGLHFQKRAHRVRHKRRFHSAIEVLYE